MRTYRESVIFASVAADNAGPPRNPRFLLVVQDLFKRRKRLKAAASYKQRRLGRWIRM